MPHTPARRPPSLVRAAGGKVAVCATGCARRWGLGLGLGLRAVGGCSSQLAVHHPCGLQDARCCCLRRLCAPAPVRRSLVAACMRCGVAGCERRGATRGVGRRTLLPSSVSSTHCHALCVHTTLPPGPSRTLAGSRASRNALVFLAGTSHAAVVDAAGRSVHDQVTWRARPRSLSRLSSLPCHPRRRSCDGGTDERPGDEA